MIMREMQKYVPMVTEDQNISIGSETIRTTHDFVHPIIFGGDQLTARNARAAQTASYTEPTGLLRLDGLVPVFEDWHARLCLVNVSASII